MTIAGRADFMRECYGVWFVDNIVRGRGRNGAR